MQNNITDHKPLAVDPLKGIHLIAAYKSLSGPTDNV